MGRAIQPETCEVAQRCSFPISGVHPTDRRLISEVSTFEQPRKFPVVSLVPFCIHKMRKEFIGSKILLHTSGFHRRFKSSEHAMELHLLHLLYRALIVHLTVLL